LFVRELTRLMQVGPADAVPETVREILLSRLARLSQPCADLLGAAAVCGLAVRPELLGRLVGTNLDALEEAVTARVLTRGADGLRFSHDLYRETLRDGLPAGRRAALHSTAGRVLASLRDAGASVPASEVAAHFLAAGPDAVPEAVRYSALAGREAAARTAHSDAAAHYRAALNLAVAGPERRDLLVALAESLGHAGATAAAQSAYRDLAELAERTGDPFALASAALGLHGLGFRGVTATHLRLLSDAASQVPRDAFALRSQLLTALGRDLSITRSPGRASAIVREAGTLAAESGDARTLARALLAQHDIVWRPGGADERLAILADMADAADRAADPDLVAQAALLRATALIELGAPEGVALLHTYVQLSERLGHARGRWGALSRHATLAAIAGRHAEARSFADSALKLGLMIGQPDVFAVHATLGLSLGLLAPRDLGAGLPGAEAESVPDLDVDPSDPVAPMLPMLRAALLLSAGATDRARAEFTGFAVPAAQMGYHLEMQAITASVAAAVGSTEQREQAYALLADYAGTHVVVGGCASYTGSVDHHLGMLCAALGRHAEAVAHLEAAVAQHERLGAPAWAELDRAELAKLADATAFVFRRDGRVWTLGFHGQEVHLPHTKGLADLATLLAKPGSDIPALELLGVPATTAAPVLDDQARRAYRARITQLDTAIAEATDDAERHLAERAELVRAITAAAGLGGRTRQLGSDAERARKAVSARIRDALDQILQAHPELGLHLRGTVRTGTYCGYHPSDPIHWRL
jgi:tetratricopeptide (TPR) repeat protein